MSDGNRPYRPIRDYALIGDAHSAALIGTDGSIDWCCMPHFDSPAIFCRILDAHKGGWFRVGPAGQYNATRSYVGPTNVLATTFTSGTGQFRLTDFMPVERHPAGRRVEDIATNHQIVRIVEGLAGETELEIEFRPTFDFARAHTRIEIFSGTAIAEGGEHSLILQCPVRLQSHASGSAYAHTHIRAGDRFHITVTYSRDAVEIDELQFDVDGALGQTLDYWRNWSGRCTYQGPYRDLVERSALTLKLLTYEPTGGVIAAPTASLLEVIGGLGNWDYRYVWLRDAAMSLDALMLIGYHDEAARFFDWVEDLCLRCTGSLQIMYSLDGRSTPKEQSLEHLEGYRRSRPVRIGNETANQRQLDVYGHVIDAIGVCHERLPRPVRPELWSRVRLFADQAAAHWREPDHGPWEVRGEPQHYVYSKLLCWVALDRARRIGHQISEGPTTDKWRAERDEIRQAILTQGYNEQLGAFTYVFNDSVLDSGALAIPLVDFLPPSDPRVQSTPRTIHEQLSVNGLVYRNFTKDLKGEATFTLCSFWLVENLMLAGRVDEARELFERIASHANDVGLLSEEIDPHTGELLGNFPQGYTHLALIRSAVRMAQAQERVP